MDKLLIIGIYLETICLIIWAWGEYNIWRIKRTSRPPTTKELEQALSDMRHRSLDLHN